MQVMIAQYAARVLTQAAHQTQHLQRFGSAIDQITDEPELIAVGAKADARNQFGEFSRAALHIANGPTRHALMQHSRDRETKSRNGSVEGRTVISHHLIAALHGADRGFEHRAARVAKA